MLRTAFATALRRASRSGPSYVGVSILSPSPPPPPLRLVHHDAQNGSTASANPAVLQAINYALSNARSKKSDESYREGTMILEQCLNAQSSEDQAGQNSMGTLLLAMAHLLYESGNIDDAYVKLKGVLDLTETSLGVRAAACESAFGLSLQLGLDDDSTKIADNFLQLLEEGELKSDGGGSEILRVRARAVKGLAEFVKGNIESAESFFQGLHADCNCNAALSYGEFLHATRNFTLAKELYQRLTKEVHKNVNFSDINTSGVCNMAPNEVLLAATFALGQLEMHMGNFGDAEEILTEVLLKTEEQFGPHHPKVGVVLTCMAFLFRNKARQEGSSSLLIQEGLYRKALGYLNPPPVDVEGLDVTKINGRDMAALARGGYAEVLCVQQHRKHEGEKLKSWADNAWRNRRMSLAAAVDFPEAANVVPVIDARVIRVL
ncbi:hypothetical protein SLEP1_g17828 [Rubroshorea leprosula]|uniref:Uncharacterized protein n=1 Tax=Rubroshorea leprosula TaxID=152421 RepID=A0AAV5J7A4_9ROSI|nr:hypothetical protein SLEP1_g17828 [Rubroshorea leprosula]